MRYDAGILKWYTNELQEMDRKLRKFTTTNRELHPRSDVVWLYVSRENSSRELTRCENCMSKENGLNLYVKNNIEPLEPLLVAARTS